MNIGTKLILLLTLATGATMFLASILSLRVREVALEAALRDELRAHAVTLQIALEENYAAGQAVESRVLIDRLRENSRVYAVLLFDERGEMISISQPDTSEIFRRLPEISDVLASGEPVEAVRVIESAKYLSIITPLQLSSDRRGALEIVKPLALIEDDIRRARVNWLTTTLFLLALILLVVAVVLHNSLTKPFQELLKGANALGKGDLDYRVQVPKTGDELALLAQEFNRMADRLAEQRRVAETEAESRFGLERELRHTERLASVGRLAAGVAHELGAPLNVIDARAEQLIEKPDAALDKRQKNLTIIRAQTDKISRLVRQLLTLARPFNFRFAEIDLSEAVAAVLEQISENARRQAVEIEFTGSATLKVAADRDYLQQVFMNIAVNALQAMPDGGRLGAATGETQKNGTSFAFIKFTDTGGGIAEENLEKIFDPFYTTKDIGQGTGLGLTISHRIVEEHNGLIEAANNAAGGACITVYLPLSKKDSND